MTSASARTTQPLASIDGQTIHVASMRELVDRTVARCKAGLGFTLYTLNMDHLVKRRIDPAFRDAYTRATFVTADGAPLVWLARRQGVRLERATGADLLEPLCKAAAEAGIPVAFFGSSPDSLRLAARILRLQFPALDICHIEAPRQGFDPKSREAEAAMARIAASGARFCFVALGAPKQELFSDHMAAKFPHVGFFGIGAAVDFVSGAQTRAPVFFQDKGLEWLWRLGQNPGRLAARYLRCAGVLADLALIEPLQRRLFGSVAGKSRG